MGVTFPNESAEYRAARDKLLQHEVALRREMETVAAEVRALPPWTGIRAHRDSSGHDLCWHHPRLWGLLPEPIPKNIAVPAWPQFLRGCVKYRESLDRELPDAPRTNAESNNT